MKKINKIFPKKSILKRRAFFYEGLLVVKSPWVVDLLQTISLTSKENKIEGTSFFPFVFFVRSNRNFTHYFLTHESIHARQSVECALVGVLIGLMFGLSWPGSITLFFTSFAMLYVFGYILLRIFFSHHHSYLLLFFEQEAWLNEGDRRYLKDRNSFAWVLMLMQSLQVLRDKSYRKALLDRLIEIRTERKKHFKMKEKLQLHEKQSL